MEEAQKEMERNTTSRLEDGVEDEEDEKGEYEADAERRSVKDADRDLLEGAEATVDESLSGSRANSLVKDGQSIMDQEIVEEPVADDGKSISDIKKVLEFDRE